MLENRGPWSYTKTSRYLSYVFVHISVNESHALLLVSSCRNRAAENLVSLSNAWSNDLPSSLMMSRHAHRLHTRSAFGIVTWYRPGRLDSRSQTSHFFIISSSFVRSSVLLSSKLERRSIWKRFSGWAWKKCLWTLLSFETVKNVWFGHSTHSCPRFLILGTSQSIFVGIKHCYQHPAVHARV